jgi:cell division inhibitor SulA
MVLQPAAPAPNRSQTYIFANVEKLAEEKTRWQKMICPQQMLPGRRLNLNVD